MFPVTYFYKKTRQEYSLIHIVILQLNQVIFFNLHIIYCFNIFKQIKSAFQGIPMEMKYRSL